MLAIADPGDPQSIANIILFDLNKTSLSPIKILSPGVVQPL